MKKTLYSSIIATVIFITLLTGCSQTTSKQRYSASFLELFDTVTQIIGYTDSKEQFTEYTQLMKDELETYHKLYDIYNDYDGINNIKTINDNAGIEPVKVDRKIIDLLLLGKQKYEETDGAFNIAMGSVLTIWHNYREEGIADPEHSVLPPMELLQKADEHTDINDIIIDEENSSVYLSDKDISIDVGSVGKGYAVEQVALLAESKGFTQFILSVGGNIRAVGGKEDGTTDWNVGIQNPDRDSENSTVKNVNLRNISLVTSGDYQRYYTVDGKKYCHIINDETLMPSDYFSSVSILCKDSGIADAFSTALFNMPLEEGMNFIESLDNTEALWIDKNGEITMSSGFEKYIKK